MRRRSKLTITQILTWADEFHRQHGSWPRKESGPIPGTDEGWQNIDRALRMGWRGLARSSLPKLLALHRGYRNKKGLPKLTEMQIVHWAEAWRRKTKRYPKRHSGPVPGVPGETWARINNALVHGLRGLPGGSSLARLLAEYRSVRNDKQLPRFTIPGILAWVDAYRRRTGAWPRYTSGKIEGTDETWTAVDMALRNGLRGLPGGSSLAQLLAQQRGVKNEKRLPPLTVNGIWAWMVSHHCRTGQWPTAHSGRVIGTRWETWAGVAAALRRGRRALKGTSSLKQLRLNKLAEHARAKDDEREPQSQRPDR